MLRDIRAQVTQLDPEQQVTHAQDLETWIVNEQDYGQQRFVATLFSVFAVLALVLAAVGLYSVVSYGVATRTNEFGIRMALGAKATDVFRLVLSSTSMSVGAGLATGLMLCLVFNKLATKWVNESSHDPLILAGVTLLLVTAALLASFVPARRAAAVDPMVALRYE
jgi:ABC-type antimicrobial peptide transport system permease subunit